MTQPQELVGTFIVEVGERQAWPFVTFCDNDTTPSREARLYIDTEFTVNGSNDVSLEAIRLRLGFLLSTAWGSPPSK